MQSVKEILTDHRRMIEALFEIRGRKGGIVPFLLYPIQNKYWDNRTKRDIILKPRQEAGFSTLKLAEGLMLAMTHSGFHTKIVAHTPAATKELRDNLDVMWNSLPDELKPKTSQDNVGEIIFEHLNSKVNIETAGAHEKTAATKGRGANISFLHLSEYAFYGAPEETFTALTSGMGPDSYVSIESTPNSFNDFRTKCIAAKNGQSNYKLHFFRWFDIASNQIFDDEEIELTDAEQELAAKHSLTIPQIKWRRYKIADIGERKFIQEHPEDFETCFLHSGHKFFDTESLKWHQQNAQEPIRTLQGGAVRIFAEVIPGRKYVIGADTSEGNHNSTYSSGRVLDKDTGEEVCHIYGKFHPEYFAKLLAKIGIYYNKALVGPERNNHGHTVIYALKETERYHNIYMHGDDKLGWITNGETRPMMLDHFEKAVNKKHFKPRCKIAIDEMFSFVIGKDGKPEALQGSYDDTVLAGAIAWQLRQQKAREYKALW